MLREKIPGLVYFKTTTKPSFKTPCRVFFRRLKEKKQFVKKVKSLKS
jgi:hypothetical protein